VSLSVFLESVKERAARMMRRYWENWVDQGDAILKAIPLDRHDAEQVASFRHKRNAVSSLDGWV
jgi:hypothetical protein